MADQGIKLVAKNKKARFNYELGDRMEAGLVLSGTEVKSLRMGKGNLTDSYAKIKDAYCAAAALQSTMLPDDVAANIVWLLQAPQVTGQLLTVDAGRSVGRG